MTEAQRIYNELKQEIVTCKLAPGLSISELEQADRGVVDADDSVSRL
jgi:DNA-binding GntR family transcriptional regulator